MTGSKDQGDFGGFTWLDKTVSLRRWLAKWLIQNWRRVYRPYLKSDWDRAREMDLFVKSKSVESTLFGDVPYYGATGQVGFIDKHIFDEELVLLGEDGAPFLDSGKPKAYLIRGKSWVNNHAHVLRGKPGLLNSFLLYQLNNLDYRPYVSGTTRLKLPQGPMKSIPLLVPLESEQRRIVAEIEKQFTRLEAGVAALRRVQASLKRYRAAVLKAACEGRLVPTEAELAKTGKRKAKFETGEELLARILAERRKNWQGRGQYREPTAPDTDGLSPLPPGWTHVSVEAVGFVQLGRQRAPKHHTGPNMRPYLRVANVYEDRIDLGDVKVMNFTPEEFEVFRLEPNDILLNEGQSLELVGRPALYRGELPGACFTNTLVRFRPCPSLDVKFALSVFRAFMHSGRFQKIANWTTNIAHLGADRFAKLALALDKPVERASLCWVSAFR